MQSSDSVLIVDDQPEWLDRFNSIVSEAGYQCEVAGSYEDGLDALRRRPSVLVLDLQLRAVRLSDEEFMGWRLAQQALLYNVPVVVVTGYGSIEDANRAFRKYRVVAFLDKGKLTKTELVARVAEGVKASLSALLSGDAKQSAVDKLQEVFGTSLILQFSVHGADVQTRIFDSPAGQAKGTFNNPYGDEEWRAIVKALERRDVDERYTSEQVAFLQGLGFIRNGRLWPRMYETIGRILCDALFSGEMQTALTATLSQARAARGMVYGQFRFDEDAVCLASLPWELLHDGKRFLVPSRMAITRYLTDLEPPVPLEVSPPLSMLYVAPRPSDIASLPDNEWQATLEALQPLVDEGLLHIDILDPPTHKRLVEVITAHDQE